MIRTSFGLVLLALAACAHAPPPPPPAPTEPPEALRARDFYPLQVGEKWTYDVKSGGHEEQRTVAIVRQENGFFLDNQNGALRLDSRGLRDRDRYLLEEPLTQGHSWSSVLSLTETEHYEIVEAGRPCTAPAGTYARCVVVRGTERIGNGRTAVNVWTYAEGVGLVRLESGVSEGGKPAAVQLTVALLRFEPAP